MTEYSVIIKFLLGSLRVNKFTLTSQDYNITFIDNNIFSFKKARLPY